MLNLNPSREMGFYAYLWLREDGTPYYAGKGTGKRAFSNKGHSVSPPRDSSRIVVFRRSSEQDAFETEMELIRNWGRKDNGTGCLYNYTNGGEGMAGHFPSEETRKKLHRPKTAEHRRKISAGHKGMQKSPEWCQHIGDAKRGKTIQKLQGAHNAQWGKLPANVDELRKLNASRPRDAKGRFFNDKLKP